MVEPTCDLLACAPPATRLTGSSLACFLQATINQCRELVAKQPGNYKRFEDYDTRRQAKRVWGEVLEHFLRNRGQATRPRQLKTARRCSLLPSRRVDAVPALGIWEYLDRPTRWSSQA